MNIATSSTSASGSRAERHNVPVRREPCRIVLCFDGTAKQFNVVANTNVSKLYSAFRKDEDNDSRQKHYYQPGMGTYYSPQFKILKFPLVTITRLADQVTGRYLSEHVLTGYQFLIDNYIRGDRIFIFGFSRGAYTARVLAGMLHKVGLLRRGYLVQLYRAWDHYRFSGPDNEAEAQAFKAGFCQNVTIDFVGVWDTVSSVGVMSSKSLPFVNVNPSINIFRHALALDERRTRFRPALYHRDPPATQRVAGSDGTEPSTETRPTVQDVRELWFPGSHSDVGGGNKPDTERRSLSNISLRWMIEQVALADREILFNLNQGDSLHISPTIVQQGPPEGQDAPLNEDGPRDDQADRERQDAIQDITDPLCLWKTLLWWVLEILPFPYNSQAMTGRWATTFWPNFGRARHVPPGSIFHRSVQMRTQELGYEPKAHYTRGTERYET